MQGDATGGPPAPAQEAGSEAAADEGLRRPISEAEPTGSDPKLTDDFDKIQGEITKLDNVAGGEPNWALVRDTSHQILEKVAKDLRCLVWWAHARFRLEGGPALRASMLEVVGCVKKFAAGLHPKRDKARAAALEWLGARLEADLPVHLKTAPAELIDDLRKSYDELQAALEGSVASFDGLYRARSALKSVKIEVPKPVAPAKPAAVAPRPAAAPMAAAPAASGAPPQAAIPEGLEDLVEQLLERASSLAATDGESALSLRLRRQALWMGLPAVNGRKYECESLQPKVRMELDQMCTAKKWPELFERVEALFPEHPFCLDITYWSAQAAAELIGPPASDALASELVALVIRDPKLTRSTDRNGQPLATANTKTFIASFLTPKGDTAAAPAAAPAPAAVPAAQPGAAPAPAPVALEALPADVEALFAAKKLADAVRLASASSAGLSGRMAFCRHLVLAERIELAGNPALSYSLFRALMSQMRTATLHRWEPALEARCIRGYLQGARATKQAVENERELLDALMLLDPGAAVGLV